MSKDCDGPNFPNSNSLIKFSHYIERGYYFVSESVVSESAATDLAKDCDETQFERFSELRFKI